MTLFGDSLASLQQRYLGIVLLNGMLVAAIVLQVSGRLTWAWFALFWYLVASERFQVFAGTTGPIATVPLLLAVLFWSGRPLRGREGWIFVAALGLGIGCSLFTRQQAGLLALGAITFLTGCRWRKTSSQAAHAWPCLLSLPVISVLAFLLWIGLEGEGLQIIIQGLGTVAGYSSRQTPLLNYYVIFRTDEVSIIAFAAALAVWLTLLICRRPLAPWFELSGFCLLGALATTVQFWTRPYGHYMLIGLPFFIIGSVLVLGHYVNATFASPHRKSVHKAFVLALVALPLLSFKGRPESIQLWRVWKPDTTAMARSQWHLRKRVKQDLRTLRQFVTAGESMYVYPPRHNSPYFFSGGRGIAKTGYGFIVPNIDELPFDQLKWVIVIERELDESDRAEFTQSRELVTALRKHRFRALARLKTMTLWVSP